MIGENQMYRVPPPGQSPLAPSTAFPIGMPPNARHLQVRNPSSVT